MRPGLSGREVNVVNGGQRKADWRIKLGFTLFIASIAWPVLLPVLKLAGLPGSTIAAFSGAMLVAAEILMLAGAAIAGKEGFAYIKTRIFRALKSYGPPEQVSPMRYRAGLVLFVAPLLLAWAAPYGGHLIPGSARHQTGLAIAGDVMLLVSLFVLGGAFWDKLRSLFVHGAKAIFPKPS